MRVSFLWIRSYKYKDSRNEILIISQIPVIYFASFIQRVFGFENGIELKMNTTHQLHEPIITNKYRILFVTKIGKKRK